MKASQGQSANTNSNPNEPTSIEDFTGLSEDQQTLFDADELLFNVAEFIRIMIFSWIFFLVIKKLVKWLNLKYKKDHEDKIILYLSLFQLINNSAVIVVISIQSLISNDVLIKGTDGELFYMTKPTCIRDMCTQELSNFFLVYCFLQLIFTLFYKTIVVDYINRGLSYLKSYKKRQDKMYNMVSDQERGAGQDDRPDKAPEDPLLEMSKQEGFASVLKNTQTQPSNLENLLIHDVMQKVVDEKVSLLKSRQKKTIDKIITKFYLNPADIYEDIDKEIDYQIWGLGNEELSVDYDPNLEDYLSIFNNFSYTTMFGVLMPLSFLTSIIIATVETHLDKNELLKFTKRPIPQSANTIGLWLKMIKVVAVLSIFTNSFYVAFILFEDKSTTTKFFSFLILVVIFTLINMFYKTVNKGLPQSVVVGMNRAEFLKDMLFTVVKLLSQNKDKAIIKSTMKIFNKVDTTKRLNVFDALNDASKNIDEKEKVEKEIELAQKIALKAAQNKPQINELNLVKDRDGNLSAQNSRVKSLIGRGRASNLPPTHDAISPVYDQNAQVRDNSAATPLAQNTSGQTDKPEQKVDFEDLNPNKVIFASYHEDKPMIQTADIKGSIGPNDLKIAMIADPNTKYDAPGNSPTKK